MCYRILLRKKTRRQKQTNGTNKILCSNKILVCRWKFSESINIRDGSLVFKFNFSWNDCGRERGEERIFSLWLKQIRYTAVNSCWTHIATIHHKSFLLLRRNYGTCFIKYKFVLENRFSEKVFFLPSFLSASPFLIKVKNLNSFF